MFSSLLGRSMYISIYIQIYRYVGCEIADYVSLSIIIISIDITNEN